MDVVYQTNETSCSVVPGTFRNCSIFDSSVPHPNLLGHDRDEAPNVLLGFLEQTQQFQSSLNCYPHMEEFVCNVYFPQCDLESKSIVPPCREMLEEMQLGCVMFRELFHIYLANPNNPGVFDNEYLPSRERSIPCWYKPVMCAAPFNTTDTVIASGFNDSGIYYGGSELQYSCADESLVISGRSKVTCLCNGLWSETLVCASILLMILLPVLSLLAISTPIAGIIIHCIKRRRKKAALILTRRRAFDAYVCNTFDQDDDFVVNTVCQS